MIMEELKVLSVIGEIQCEDLQYPIFIYKDVNKGKVSDVQSLDVDKIIFTPNLEIKVC